MSFISPQTPSAFVDVAGFANLPSASSADPDTVYRVSGVGTAGFSFWVSDGQFWRPQNGSVELFASAGYSEGASRFPIATVTTVGGNTYVPFILSTPIVIPRGMLAPSSRLVFDYRAIRENGGGTGSYQILYASDPVNGNVLLSSGDALATASPRYMYMYVDLLMPDNSKAINPLIGPFLNASNGATTGFTYFPTPISTQLDNDANDIEFFMGAYSPTSLTDLYSLYAYRVKLQF